MRCEHRANRDPLLLPTGEFTQWSIAQISNAEYVEDLFNPAPHGVARQTQLLHAIGQLFLDCVSDKARQGILAHHANHSGEFARTMRGRVETTDRDATLQTSSGEVRHHTVDRS